MRGSPWLGCVLVMRPNDALLTDVAGLVEVHLVEDVEELRPELDVHVVGEAEIPGQAHVPVIQTWSDVGAFRNCAERADISGRECQPVEPYRLIGIGGRVEADTGRLRPIATDAIARDVGARGDGIRLTSLELDDAGDLPAVQRWLARPDYRSPFREVRTPRT